MTAWAARIYMRSFSISNAIQDLLQKIERDGATAFEETFGCSLQDTETIQKLVDAKTVSIGRLVELMPTGTVVDPTPLIYDTTCYAAAGLMGVALLANLAIQPLDFVQIATDLDKNNGEAAKEK